MIQDIEIPMKKETMTKKAAFMRGIPSVFLFDANLVFLIKNIKKPD
jgi:hypothetical protein